MMSFRKSLLVIATLGASSLCATFAAHADGAIAYDKFSGRAGWSWNARPQQAARAAMAECGTRGCVVVTRIRANSCGALATTANNRGWGAATRPNREAAKYAAYQACQRVNYGECRLRVSDCSR